MSLPPEITAWFKSRGWRPHAHQLALFEAKGDSLLIAPTGGGKTLAGFLPTLSDLYEPGPGMHTLYVSPLKALSHDIARNLAAPIEELALDIRIEDRTGDTKAAQRARQRVDPPHILLTTPESLTLMLSYPEAGRIFANLKRVVIDEIHALAESKRGDQLMLGLSRLRAIAPGVQTTGLSATVEDPAALARFMGGAKIYLADPGPPPDIAMLPTTKTPPWAGGGGHYAVRDVMRAISEARMSLVFINTRAQAELFYQALWEINDAKLPIGLHHGSLARDIRARAEAAMAAGELRAIVCTGSLDLGIDWGDVDLVIQVGAPKNIKRLVQRIGRAGHQYNVPSRARLVPANRFEVLESIAALEAVREGALDGEPRGPGPLDVLCQHILITACSGPFVPGELYEEIITGAGPYRDLGRDDFDRCLEFCATGGYALRRYDQWQRLLQRGGCYQLRDPRSARGIRMNIGTIVESEKLKVVQGRRRGGGALGEIEESFAASLSPGDSFLIGGQTVRYDRLRDMLVEVTRTPTKSPKIAVFSGMKMSTSTQLSSRVLELVGSPERWSALPDHTREWLELQREVSILPQPGTMTCESFTRAKRAYFCLYGFAGQNAHQTLGLLLTRRMEEAGLGPLGFVCTDYALLIWSVDLVRDPAPLLSLAGLRDGLQGWLGENALMKRSFRSVATVSGLIQRNRPGARKSGKQVTFSTDIIYDTLRKYDPDHLLLQITRAQADRGLIDFDRIEAMLLARPRIVHRELSRVSPLAAPLLLEQGSVPIKGMGIERMIEAEAARMIQDAGLDKI